MQTGGGIVFCVGSLLFDYLSKRLKLENLTDLKNDNWTLSIIAFKEVESEISDSINFEIDESKVLFTSYQTFVHSLINQGQPNRPMFKGSFEQLDGENYTVADSSEPTLF